MHESLDALEAAALGFANELRGVHGLGPVDALLTGVPYSTCGCPVAATAGGWRNGVAGWEVGETAIFVGPRGGVKQDHGRTPSDVLEFMAAFDVGLFPHLVTELEAVAA